MGRPYPTRVCCELGGKQAQIVLDELRTMDKVHLVRRLGRVAESARQAVLAGLAEMIAR